MIKYYIHKTNYLFSAASINYWGGRGRQAPSGGANEERAPHTPCAIKYYMASLILHLSSF